MNKINLKVVELLIALVVALGCLIFIFNINTAMADTARTVEIFTDTDEFYVNNIQYSNTPVSNNDGTPITEIISKELLTATDKQIMHVGEEKEYVLSDKNDKYIFEIDITTQGGFNYKLSTSGCIGIEIYNSRDIDENSITGEPIYSKTLNGNGGTASINIAQYLESGKYRILINNILNGSSNLVISVENAEEIALDNEYQSGEKEIFYAFRPTNNCRLVIENNNNGSDFELVNANGNLLNLYENSHFLSRQLFGGESYFIKVTRRFDIPTAYKFSVSYESLGIGENLINKGTFVADKIVEIGPYSTNFVASITVDGATISGVDENNTEIVDLENIQIQAGKKYYLYVTDIVGSQCTINFEINSIDAGAYYLENITGNIGSGGYSIIKYSASNEGYYTYSIDSNNTYEIYNGQFNELSNTTVLFYGQTYYIKVYGVENQDFTMSFVYASKKVIESNLNVVKNGVYRFDVTEDNDYLFKIYITEMDIDIIGMNNNILHTNIKVSNVSTEISLSAGKYVVKIKNLSGNHYFSLIPKSGLVQSDEVFASSNTTNIDITANEVKTLKFKPEIDATYCFELGAYTGENFISLYYYDSAGVYQNHDLDSITDIKFLAALSHEIEYFISFENNSNATKSNSFKVYLQTVINNVHINGKTVIRDFSRVDPDSDYDIELMLGCSYSITYDLLWEPTEQVFNITTMENAFTVNNNIISIDLNMNNNEKLKTILIYTDAISYLIQIKLVAPYTANASLVGNDLTVQVELNEKVDLAVYDDFKIQVSPKLLSNELSIVDKLFKLNINDFSFMDGIYTYSFKNNKIIASSYALKVTTSLNYEGNNYKYDFENLNLETVKINSESSSEELNSARVYLTGNIHYNITLGENVETVILKDLDMIGCIQVNGYKEITFLCENSSIIEKSGKNKIIFDILRERTNFIVEGSFEIIGIASTALMRAVHINLSGDGTFSIICDDINGNVNATTALLTDSFNIVEGSILEIKIIPSDGIYGQKANDCANELNGTDVNAESEEEYTNGGNGELARIDCSSLSNFCEDSFIIPTFGNGGDGENGSKVKKTPTPLPDGNGDNGSMEVNGDNKGYVSEISTLIFGNYITINEVNDGINGGSGGGTDKLWAKGGRGGNGGNGYLRGGYGGAGGWSTTGKTGDRGSDGYIY